MLGLVGTATTSKALGRLQSRGSLRASLTTFAAVLASPGEQSSPELAAHGAANAGLPGAGLALSVHQAAGGSTGCPWWTERASGARRCPDPASTVGSNATEARSAGRGAPSAARAFEGTISSHYSPPRTVPYARALSRFAESASPFQSVRILLVDPAETDRLTGAYLNTAFQTELRRQSAGSAGPGLRRPPSVTSHRTPRPNR